MEGGQYTSPRLSIKNTGCRPFPAARFAFSNLTPIAGKRWSPRCGESGSRTLRLYYGSAHQYMNVLTTLSRLVGGRALELWLARPPGGRNQLSSIQTAAAIASLRAADAAFKLPLWWLTHSAQVLSAVGAPFILAMRETLQPFKQDLHHDWWPSALVAFFAKLLIGIVAKQRVHIFSISIHLLSGVLPLSNRRRFQYMKSRNTLLLRQL